MGRDGLQGSRSEVAILGLGHRLACRGTGLASPNVPLGFYSWRALPGLLVVLVGRYRLGPVWPAVHECVAPGVSVVSGGQP